MLELKKNEKQTSRFICSKKTTTLCSITLEIDLQVNLQIQGGHEHPWGPIREKTTFQIEIMKNNVD